MGKRSKQIIDVDQPKLISDCHKPIGLVQLSAAIGAVLYSSNEPSELLERFCNDDCTIDIVVSISIITLLSIFIII